MSTKNDEATFETLDALAVSLVHGGDAITDFLNSPSGEGNLTCEQALSAHCSAKCTQGAVELLRQLRTPAPPPRANPAQNPAQSPVQQRPIKRAR
jgi:hypothetical protein